MGSRFSSDQPKMKAAILLLALVVAGTFAQDSENKNSGKFLIGIRRTNVITTASTTTLSVAYTCYSKINTGTCSGKRRRRRELVPINNPDESLDSSVDLSPTVVEGVGESGQEKLVVWTSTTTTLTFTSSTTLSGTTLSVNFSCTASGISLPPACG